MRVTRVPIRRVRNRSARLYLASVFIIALIVIVTTLVKSRSRSYIRDGAEIDGDTSSRVSHSTGSDQCSKDGVFYSIVLDAGSTGSRVHVFTFTRAPERQNALVLKGELFEQVKPGLSEFADDPVRAVQSIMPLLMSANVSVPAELHSCTPIALHATAGLRLIGRAKSDAIIQEIRKFLRSSFQFPFEDSHVSVINGTEEGVYGWLTVNFLTDAVREFSSTTAAILDMGGASTQVVFSPTRQKAAVLRSAPSGFVREVSFEGRSFLLYHHSYLGFGLKEAANTLMHRALVADPSLVSRFPCLPAGYTHRTSVRDGMESLVVRNDEPVNQSFSECVRLLQQHVVRGDVACNTPPCAFNGVFQPSLVANFDGPIYALSYFYDRLIWLYPDGGKLPVSTFREVGEKICMVSSTSLSSSDMASRNLGTMCLDYAYLYTLLRHGYGLPDERMLEISKKIRGIEAAWPLGVSLKRLRK